jgi:hypothetical protein
MRNLVSRNIFQYIVVAAIIIISNLLWYNFRLPPISANSGFNIFPFRQIKISLLPLNIYSWPVSYIPPILGMPDDLIYALFYAASGSSYSIALFLSNVVWEILGAFSIFYLSRIFLKSVSLEPTFAYASVIFIAFNEGVIQGAQFDLSASLIAIAMAILYLEVFRNRLYALLLGVYSFFMLSSFPAGSLEYSLELLAIFFFFGIIFFSNAERRTMSSLKRFIIAGIYSILAIVAANAYLVYPFLSVKSLYFSALSAASPSYAFSFSFDKIEVIQNAIRLINNWADYSGYAPTWMVPYLSNPVIYLLLFLAPALAIVSIIFRRKKPVFILFLCTAMLIFLSKADNPPFGIVFQWIILHIDILRGFYNGDSFSGFLIIAYSLLIGVSLSAIFIGIRSRLAKSARAMIRRAERAIPLFVVVLIVALMIASVYPALSYQLEEGNPSTPIGSALPQYYYNASNYLVSQGGYPAMVFPEVNTFNANTVNNTTWYNGVNIYPGIIYSPSVSGSYALNFVGGRGSVYQILSSVYSPQSYDSLIRLNSSVSFSGYSSFGDANVTYSPYLSGPPFNDSVAFFPGQLIYSVNRSVYHEGGQWLIGSLNRTVNLSSYEYLILNYTDRNVSTSSLELGLFDPDGAGNWYYFSSYPTIGAGNTSYLVVSIKNPTIYGGGSLDNVSGVVINYDPAKNSTGTGTFALSGFSISPSIKYSYGRILDAMANDMNTLGIKYAYVDTSIGSGNGTYYRNLFDSNSSMFTPVFHEGTVYIYRNNAYAGLFQTESTLNLYKNESSLLNGLYYNISTDGIWFNSSASLPYSASYSNPNMLWKASGSTEYTVTFSNVNKTTLLLFKTDFNTDWNAYLPNGTKLDHFMADGYANGFVVPSNITLIYIKYAGVAEYKAIELSSLSVPAIEFGLFVYLMFRRRKS